MTLSAIERRLAEAAAEKGGRATAEAELATLYADCFTTGAGQRVMSHLCAAYFDVVLPPNATEGELRDLNARRALVRLIAGRVTAGVQQREQARKQAP